MAFKKKNKTKKKKRLKKGKTKYKTTKHLPTAKGKKKQIKNIRRRGKQPKGLPHMIHICVYRKNVFLHLRDMRGNLRYTLTTGMCGFGGKNKKAFMAVVTLTQRFFKYIKRKEYKHIFFIFKNMKHLKAAFFKGLKSQKKNISLLISGMWYDLRLQFNGCRRKKQRRL